MRGDAKLLEEVSLENHCRSCLEILVQRWQQELPTGRAGHGGKDFARGSSCNSRASRECIIRTPCLAHMSNMSHVNLSISEDQRTDLDLVKKNHEALHVLLLPSKCPPNLLTIAGH